MRSPFGGRRSLGAGAQLPQIAWAPFRYQALAARRWDSEFSSPPPPPPRRRRRRRRRVHPRHPHPHPHPPHPRRYPHPAVVEGIPPTEVVARIVGAFKARGESAGMHLARAYGPRYVHGAKLYVTLRAASEEDLARRVAALTALYARGRDPLALVRKLFLEARLAEVRSSVQKAQTPPQAVKDRPEVPTQEAFRVPRWVSFLALGLSGVSVWMGWQQFQKRRAKRDIAKIRGVLG